MGKTRIVGKNNSVLLMEMWVGEIVVAAKSMGNPVSL